MRVYTRTAVELTYLNVFVVPGNSWKFFEEREERRRSPTTLDFKEAVRLRPIYSTVRATKETSS